MVRDPYMDQERALGRLLIEYEKHGQLIVAFDFDDTVFNTHERPGWEYNQVIELLRRVQPYAHIICWSASVPERYESMWQYFRENNIPCQAINEDAPWVVPHGRKIYANIYLDDRAGLESAYSLLSLFVETMENYKNGGV